MTGHRSRETGLFQASSATRWIAGGAAALAGFFGVAFAWPQISAAHGTDSQLAPDTSADGYAPDEGVPGPTVAPTTPSRSPSTSSSRPSAGASSSTPSSTPSTTPTTSAPTASRRRPRAVTGAS